MKLIKTHNLRAKDIAAMSKDEQLRVYNGLDSCLTHEIHPILFTLLEKDTTKLIYKFERALQGPALDMMMFGVRIDAFERMEMIKKLSLEHERMRLYLNDLGIAFGQYYLNANSPKSLAKLFYETLDLPEQKIWNPAKAEMRVTTNREALENLSDYMIAQPFINAILAIRDIGQQLSVLKTTIRDGRIYTSLNQGKETGRWSSSSSAFGDGRNLQNIMDSLRNIFIPDENCRMGYSDLEQAESRCVAYLSGDENYIEAHNSGDVHTFVAKLVWPEIKDVNEIYYRHWTYRDLAKRAAHATNYYATAQTIAKHLKIPIEIAREFQRRYFFQFPGIREWHHYLARLLGTEAAVTTPFGRMRMFFNRLNDDATLREAIAHGPQSLTADYLNLGMYRVWEQRKSLGIQLLLPIHDAILYQFSIGNEQCIPQVEFLMSFPVEVKDMYGTTRLMTIPVETKAGYNWKPYSTSNLAGMAKYGSTEYTYQVPPPVIGLLDRVLS